MMINLEIIHNIISDYNLVLKAMYYDEHVKQPEFEISYTQHADRNYYNCVHNLSDFCLKNIDKIEKYFSNKNITPCIYVDSFQCANNQVKECLIDNNYKIIESEQENWYKIDLKNFEPLNNEKYFLKKNSQFVNFKKIDFLDKCNLNNFLKINAEENNLPTKLVCQLKNNFLQNHKEKQVKHYCYLTFYKNVPVSTNCISVIKQNVFFSEGATSRLYQRNGFYSYGLFQCLTACVNLGLKRAYICCDNNSYSNHAAKKIGFQLIFKRFFWQKIYDQKVV